LHSQTHQLGQPLGVPNEEKAEEEEDHSPECRQGVGLEVVRGLQYVISFFGCPVIVNSSVCHWLQNF